MVVTKDVIEFVDHLVRVYAKYDNLSEQWVLESSDVPGFDLSKVASLLMRNNSDAAKESTSVENPEYEEYMLPALIYMLEHPLAERECLLFLRRWRKGIVTYFEKQIGDLLEERLQEYNSYQTEQGS